MKDTPRELVLNMLIAITEEQTYSHLLIGDVLNKYNYWPSRDKDFVKRLTEGTLERLITLDYIIDHYSKLPTTKMKPLIKNLLRMSAYQILYLDAIPDRAACDEAVKLAGKRGFTSLRGFVNGILRTIVRQKESLPLPDATKEPLHYLSVVHSMPQWLIERWFGQLGQEKTVRLLDGLLAIRPVTVRLRGDLAPEDKRAWLDQLKAVGVKATPHPYLPVAYELTDVPGIRNLPGFAEGWFMVQDVSSMLVVDSAGLKPTDCLLDVCAAPGGKTLHAAERAAKVLAGDISAPKLALIQDNAIRMRMDNIEIIEHDARVIQPSLVGKADVLLADLPCSGLGIIGKKRDIKYKITPEAIEEIIALQRDILRTVWQYVKPGGLMIYSTCTINRGENEDMMKWFTEQFPFETEAFPPGALSLIGDQTAMLQLLPGIHPTDGFFICRLRRNKV
ncbi:MAG: 16S rRNA (cytosine(967)-C(5))-methyltransferase RsmB [Lachnospiraceae bacterium]|jgi:16S rRNA (cytosine967-C5)-methyltransferase|nr:16S rRNA (cytosine(967)-C(5))-methyltransferase RsmB [Lachnospiraceae bacterium]